MTQDGTSGYGPGERVMSSSSPDDGTGSKRPAKRVRHFTADDRAAHRQVERSRRESFRDNLSELASLIPALAEADRSKLSKHQVIQESIKHHVTQSGRIAELERECDALRAELEDMHALASRQEAPRGSDSGTGQPTLDVDGLSVAAGPWLLPLGGGSNLSTGGRTAPAQAPRAAPESLQHLPLPLGHQGLDLHDDAIGEDLTWPLAADPLGSGLAASHLRHPAPVDFLDGHGGAHETTNTGAIVGSPGQDEGAVDDDLLWRIILEQQQQQQGENGGHNHHSNFRGSATSSGQSSGPQFIPL